jgi:long-chain acyl-CoA synthetase
MLNRIIEENCRAYGSQTALVFGKERYTYAQLEKQVARYAAGLWRLDIASQDKGLVLLLKNSPEFIFAYLAAMRLGIPAILVDPGSKSRELSRIVVEGQVAAVVCEPEHELALQQIGEQVGQSLAIYSRGRGFESLLSQTNELPRSRVYDAETAIVQYTSGTTGVAKCIARSHRNLFCEALDFNETIRLSADDHILCAIPLFHAHGLMNAFLAALYAGATLVLMQEFNRAAVVDLFSRERITIFPAVPLMFDLLSRRVIGQPPRENSLRLAFSAGAPLPSAIAGEFKQAFGVDVRQLYGTTEVGSAAINLDSDLPSTVDSVGLPMKNVRIEILREDGSLAFANEVGEVAIQSPAMPNGYLRQLELTQQRFRNGYFWPGDYGRKDARGYLYLEGRAEWLVLSTGRKVDPRDVEVVIGMYPKVREVVVIGVPGYLGEQVVKAIIVSSEPCQEQEVVDFCRERLADFKIPRVVDFVQEIPRSASGKILRKDLVP